mgnify:CR=1 FL=1
MPTVWYVAWIIMCFQGDCTKFESAPYKKNISADFCQQMLVYTFQNTVGPYYDERIDSFTIPEKRDYLQIIFKTNRFSFNRISIN